MLTMSNLVPTEEIEQIVGATRHAHQHLGRAVTAEKTVYVLHSQRCKDSGIDLRECEWSWALDKGVDPADWKGYEDRAVVLAIIHGRLFPVVPQWLDEFVIPPAPCCDLHNRNCEPPSELCCERCTEAAHPAHRDGSACIAPDLSPNSPTPPGGSDA